METLDIEVTLDGEVVGVVIEDAEAGAMIVGIEVENRNGIIEALEMIGVHHLFEMIEVETEIVGTAMITSEAEEHPLLKVEVGHQLTAQGRVAMYLLVLMLIVLEEDQEMVHYLVALLCLIHCSHTVDMDEVEETVEEVEEHTMTIIMAETHHRILAGVVEHSLQQHPHLKSLLLARLQSICLLRLLLLESQQHHRLVKSLHLDHPHRYPASRFLQLHVRNALILRWDV